MSISFRLTILLNGETFVQTFLRLDSGAYPTIKDLTNFIQDTYRIDRGYYRLYRFNISTDPFNLDDLFNTSDLNGYSITVNYYSIP